MMQHSRRKGVNGEIKQYKEMKKEAERWKELQQKKVRSFLPSHGRSASDATMRSTGRRHHSSSSLEAVSYRARHRLKHGSHRREE